MNDAPFKVRERESAIAFNIEFEGIIMARPDNSAMAKLFRADIERALSEGGLLTIQGESWNDASKSQYTLGLRTCSNFCFGLCCVSDWQKGVLALETEFKRTGLLAHAEIGWKCLDEDVWRRYWPKQDSTPFVAKIFEWEKHKVNAKLIRTVAALQMPKPPL